MLLTSLATYTNLAPPVPVMKPSPNPKSSGGQQTSGGNSANPNASGSSKSRFGIIPNREIIKMNPCSVVLDTFQKFLESLEMEQISTVLTVYPQLAASIELTKFIELLTPMSIGIINQLGIASSGLSQLITNMTKYISSPYDPQRIASIGLFSQIVPLKPTGDILSVIMLHLSSALSDSNALVRGLSIRGMAYVGCLTDHDIRKYSEMSLSALVKGMDDFNPNCFINIPLESMKGLSRIVTALPGDKLATFHVSLAIRIRPFFENLSMEIREAAILLFGDLCRLSDENNIEKETSVVPEALKEQIVSYFCLLLLHLSEDDIHIVRVCNFFFSFYGF